MNQNKRKGSGARGELYEDINGAIDPGLNLRLKSSSIAVPGNSI
jgi:hypothetical protein